MMPIKEKYFVISDSDIPAQILFSRKEAFSIGCDYLDSFDMNGRHVYAYKLKETADTYSEDNYTKDF